MSNNHAESFDTVIIGAGQAGLAVGYHLTKRGRAVAVLDAEARIGDSWRRRWDSLRVFTPARYSSLPGWSFPAPGRSFPTKDDVADYLESYAARFELPVHGQVHVDGLTRDDGGLVVTSGSRRFTAESVVVATGGYQAPRVPAFAAELDAQIVQLHSSEYRRPTDLQPGPVLVVGAGNSGGEIALESSAGHSVWLSGRDTGQEPFRPGSALDRLFVPVFWFLLHHVLTVRNPLGRKVRGQLSQRGLPLARVRRSDLASAGVERVPRVTDVRNGLPVLEDGRVLEPANVVWCTGFVNDFGWIDLPVFDEDGLPRHDRGVVPSEPGLYFIGLFFMSAGTSSLIGGVGRDAERIADVITSLQVRRAPQAREQLPHRTG